jgi:hypothetical protein
MAEGRGRIVDGLNPDNFARSLRRTDLSPVPVPAAASTRRAAPAAKPAPKERMLSAAGRRAIAEAARRRWAAIRGKNADGSKAEASAPPSDDVQFKKRMSEVMKASWAKRKKAAAKKKAA